MQDKIPTVTKLRPRRNINQEDRTFHVENWQKSGLSMNKYCQQHNLALSSFSKWSRTNEASKSTFKPMIVKSLPSFKNPDSSNFIEIFIREQIKLRLPNTTEASLIINIVKGLSNAVND